MFTLMLMLLIRLIFTIGKVIHRTNALIPLGRLPSLLLGDSNIHVVKVPFSVAYPHYELFERVFALPDIIVVYVELGETGLRNRIRQHCNDMDVLHYERFL